MTTHAELAALEAPGAGPALLAQTARVVAYPSVRAFGTIGGSVAHADPAADYPVALVAANASIEVGSAIGSRHIAAHDFFRGLFETALRRGEIVTAIHIPAGPPDGRAAYEKLSLVAGDFAIISVAAIVDRHRAHRDWGLRCDADPGVWPAANGRGLARGRTQACGGKRSAKRPSRVRSLSSQGSSGAR